MKTILLLTTLFAFTVAAPAADKDKDDKKPRKERNERKDDKKPEKTAEEKEAERLHFEVTVQGAKDAAAEADVKTYLGSIEGVKVTKCEKTEKGMEAVLSASAKISRGDVAKALRDNKELKVADFKAVRPSRDKDGKKEDKDDKKAEEKKDDKKPEDKKPEEKKPEDKKAEEKPV